MKTEKVIKNIEKFLGYVSTIALFMGGLFTIGFIIAFILGGSNGETIATLVYNKFYKLLIYAGSFIVLVTFIGFEIELFNGKSKTKKGKK